MLGKKLEEARLFNQQFKDDTSRVYAGMRRVLANDKERESLQNMWTLGNGMSK